MLNASIAMARVESSEYDKKKHSSKLCVCAESYSESKVVAGKKTYKCIQR